MSGTVKKFKSQFRKAMNTNGSEGGVSTSKSKSKPTDSDVGKKLTSESFQYAVVS